MEKKEILDLRLDQLKDIYETVSIDNQSFINNINKNIKAKKYGAAIQHCIKNECYQDIKQNYLELKSKNLKQITIPQATHPTRSCGYDASGSRPDETRKSAKKRAFRAAPSRLRWRPPTQSSGVFGKTAAKSKNGAS